jgi:hypothetical protein
MNEYGLAKLRFAFLQCRPLRGSRMYPRGTRRHLRTLAGVEVFEFGVDGGAEAEECAGVRQERSGRGIERRGVARAAEDFETER